MKRRREVPDRHGRRTNRRHPETLFEQGIARSDGGRFIADQDRLDRRARRQRRQAQVCEARPETRRVLEHAARDARVRRASRAAIRAWRRQPPAAAPSCRCRCGPAAAGSRPAPRSPRRTRRTCRQPCRACTSGSARRRAPSPASSTAPAPVAPSTPNPCASSTSSCAADSRQAAAMSRSGAMSPSMLNTPSVITSVRAVAPIAGQLRPQRCTSPCA